MAVISYDEKKIVKRVIPKRPVNGSGQVYAGREYAGSKAEVIILKDDE